jgi:pimeloyl-ACP methyl ester carboxylesterase
MHALENLLDYITDDNNNAHLIAGLGIDASDIDQDRIYLVGESMGGYGAWDLLARQPDRFAAAIAVAGSGPSNKLDQLGPTPLWTIHGQVDQLVPNELPPSGPSALGLGTLGMLHLLDPAFDNTGPTATIYVDDPYDRQDDPLDTHRLIYSQYMWTRAMVRSRLTGRRQLPV